MTLAGLLIIVALAQPVVRPLDVRGEVTTEAHIIAANEGFVWFTVGEADSFRGGGARVFRMSRDGGAVVDVIAGRDWRGVDAAPSSFTGVAVRVGGHGRGSALFTFDGEFEAHGRRLRSPAPTGLGIIAAGSNVLVFSREGVFLSTAPGQAQRLGDVNSFVEPVPSTDGRIALAVAGDAGLEVRIVDRDGGLVDGPPGRPVASAGATFLVERGQQLRNEKDELLAPVSEVLLQRNGQVVFWRPDRTVQVTDGTLAGTRFLTRTPSLLTGRFAVSNLFDGGMRLESFATGEARMVDERFFGEALQDRIVDRARELYEDGGIVRRAVHDCDWRRFEPATQELLCAFDGGLWSRATPDSPEQLLGVLAPMGRATGARLPLVGPLVRGAALLVGFPGPTWTDGVIARTFENEGVVVGQSRGKVVLEVDGLTLVDPVSGARTALGLNVQWRAFPSLRELFIQRSDGATCALQRLDARGGFEDVEPVCLRELVDVPGGLLARDLQLGWLRWQPEERRFGALAITNAASLVDADDEWVHFGTTQGTFSSEEGFVDRSQHELLHWKTGKVLRSSPGSRVHLTPQGLFSWRDGEATLSTRAGEEFTLASAWPPLVSFTSRALWVVTNR
ncbi:MAG: hypothetical protein MUC96_30705, partial [Myxococcaceae bacterium]|nr:hypothetical protein [Myxococcaceae bacterium]